MAIYAMSDIHGMYGPFMRRIKQLNDLKTVKTGVDRLILLGDYIDIGSNSFKVLETVFKLQQEAGADNMVVLMGNHDKWFLDFLEGHNDEWINGTESADVLETFLDKNQAADLNHIINHMEHGRAKARKLTAFARECLLKNHEELMRWYKKLPLYYKTDTQIFVHAGVDEEAEDWWETGTSDEMFIEKYPPETGGFYMDIIAGHVSTSSVSGDRTFHDIYYDGKSHFYIDGIDSYPRNVPDDDRTIPLLKIEEEDGKRTYFSLAEDGTKVMII